MERKQNCNCNGRRDIGEVNEATIKIINDLAEYYAATTKTHYDGLKQSFDEFAAQIIFFLNKN